MASDSVRSRSRLTGVSLTTTITTSGEYPQAERLDHVDDYHGTRVADPYRWLEDVDAPQTGAWVEAQNALTERILARSDRRAGIRARLIALWDYEKFGIPQTAGGRFFYTKNAGLQNQAVLYTARSLGATSRVLIDPNTLSNDGTVALSGLSISYDGRHVAYSVSASGSDWQTWRVREVASGRDLPDTIEWSKFSGAAWLLDGSGFFYCRFDSPAGETRFKDANYDHQLYFHALGTAQVDDALVYERPDHKDWTLGAEVTEDGRYLLISARKGTDSRNRVFVRDLKSNDSAVRGLFTSGDAQYEFVGNVGTTMYFQTTNDAPLGRLIAVEVDAPQHLRAVLPPSGDTLESVQLVGGRFIATYLHDAHSVVQVYDLTGNLVYTLGLPGLGTASGFAGREHDTTVYFAFTSYVAPAAIYALDLDCGTTTPVFAPKVNFDPTAFTSEQVFYASKDGTRVPMIVSSKVGVPRDGTAPTILYGYGGFDVSLTPAFSPAILVWLELGGIYAVANIRGGAEYGEAWHLAGTFEKKQNVFDDFIAAAEYLIAQRYTSTPKLAIAGGSNGGLLVGACMTQRPELFGATLPAVGVMDMLRFQHFTIGWAWTAEYGSADIPQQFPAIYAYSPLHNLREGTHYPATLVTTADHDDRVYPAHSFKFAAALQYAQGGPAPVLIRIEQKAGHGAGKPTTKVIDEVADRYTFLAQVLHIAEAAKES
jgi:prolyl oligopeptidase